ncbi:MAG: PLP-dependent aminotransferase family protein [Burkholderiales bacterium]|nr:PLP-dependent aminotransferase family protein [Burkholderiales bacterium]
MKYKLANRASTLKASEIRELLKLTEQPEIISFAGGLPAPELFPVQDITELTMRILATEGRQALQYSTTEGYLPLREVIANQRMKLASVDTTSDNIIITAGSQQGIDFCARLIINDGDYVICEDPSYMGAINVFNMYNVNYLPIPMDDEGMIIDELEKTLAKHPDAKVIYTIPDFQNPTGRTMSIERRKRLAELAAKYQIPVMEDNPYGELIFEGDRNPAIKSFDADGWVIYLGSFSKTFCPGYRIGWMCADSELISKFVMLKQSADLQCSTIAQREVAYYLRDMNIDSHIKEIIKVYKNRRDLMLDGIKKHFPNNIKYTIPAGGLFTWVELKPEIHAADLLVEALKENVAFVPGGAFFPNGGNTNYLRLNYSNMTEDKIVEGVERLGNVLKRYY